MKTEREDLQEFVDALKLIIESAETMGRNENSAVIEDRLHEHLDGDTLADFIDSKLGHIKFEAECRLDELVP